MGKDDFIYGSIIKSIHIFPSVYWFFFWEALYPIFSSQHAGSQDFVLHTCVLIFHTEQINLKLGPRLCKQLCFFCYKAFLTQKFCVEDKLTFPCLALIIRAPWFFSRDLREILVQTSDSGLAYCDLSSESFAFVKILSTSATFSSLNLIQNQDGNMSNYIRQISSFFCSSPCHF